MKSVGGSTICIFTFLRWHCESSCSGRMLRHLKPLQQMDLHLLDVATHSDVTTVTSCSRPKATCKRRRSFRETSVKQALIPDQDSLSFASARFRHAQANVSLPGQQAYVDWGECIGSFFATCPLLKSRPCTRLLISGHSRLGVTVL